MKKTFFLIFSALCLLNASRATAQVTIGSLVDPQPFSLLELESNGTRGFRLPQMTTAQRDALTLTGKDAARGLQIFNTTTKCVETWNGTKWIQQCPPEGPVPTPVAPSSVSYFCGIEVDETECIFTALDTKAEWYEFFLDGVPQGGVQEENFITFDIAIKDHTRVTAKYYYPLSFLKPEMMDVEGGTFMLGGAVQNSSADNSGTGSKDSIKIDVASFKMSKTQVTQAQFEYVMGTNPASYKCGNTTTNSYAQKGNATSTLPVEYVSWYDAITYCNKLSLIEDRELCYSVKDAQNNEIDWEGSVNIPTSYDDNWDAAKCDSSKNGYRLPYEAEWEYAARGGQKSQSKTDPGALDYYCSGSSNVCDVAWYFDNTYNAFCTVNGYYSTNPVATKEKANELGLFDMTGNVWEWCQDWYRVLYQQNEPHGPSYRPSSGPIYRIWRGSGWNYYESDCCVLYRNAYIPSYRVEYVGFRVACSVGYLPQ
jgi:formylglycine-generating enzyme required for sulfatase activity